MIRKKLTIALALATGAALGALALPAPAPLSGQAQAATPAPDFTLPSIDGGDYKTADWRGKPILLVNTASMCGYTPQYEDLQALSDHYGDKAVVLAVPSNDFNQELGSEAEVKQFCALNYNLTLPMTTIQHVAKADVHPIYAWLRDEHGFVPRWNFNKVLIGADGQFIASWGSPTKPMSPEIMQAIDAAIAAAG